MGCNCGGNKKDSGQVFVYVAPNGSSTTYNSELQARAAQIRNGGGTYTAKARR